MTMLQDAIPERESTGEHDASDRLPDEAVMAEPRDTASGEHPKPERGMSISGKRRVVRALRDGLQFGKYRVEHLIAIGGMSEIYRAVHLGLNKQVALKVMRPDFAENVEARERFVSEGIAAARIRHTHVVDVSDVGVVDELPFLVMELLVGEDLGMVLERQPGMPVPELIDLLLPVAFAVAEGHREGVIHRDLKPDNIFLHREGRRVIPKVLDFGVSRVMSARRITLNASVFGTPHYMAPEQARGAATDERTDQYALGVILYEGATGRLPRDSVNPLQLLHSVAYEGFSPPSAHEQLPDGLEAVILRAMAREPDERFPSMQDLAIALLPFANENARDFWELELGMSTRKQHVTSGRPVTDRHSTQDQPGEPSQPVISTPPVAADPLIAAKPGARGRGLVTAAAVAAAVASLGIGVWALRPQPTPRVVSRVAQPSATDASSLPLQAAKPDAVPDGMPLPAAPPSNEPSSASSAEPMVTHPDAAHGEPMPQRRKRTRGAALSGERSSKRQAVSGLDGLPAPALHAEAGETTLRVIDDLTHERKPLPAPQLSAPRPKVRVIGPVEPRVQLVE